MQKAYEKLMQGEHLVGLIKQMELEQARADKVCVSGCDSEQL